MEFRLRHVMPADRPQEPLESLAGEASLLGPSSAEIRAPLVAAAWVGWLGQPLDSVFSTAFREQPPASFG
jgi:hypothetical protein